MSGAVRTRFAPAPTGFLHVGGARTALYNFLLARAGGGRFILRIEDTDRERSDQAYTQAILDSLGWLGLQWDEGPCFQSGRLERYRDAAEKLLGSGAAYYDVDPQKGRAVKMRMPDRVMKIPDLIHGEVQFDTALAGDFVIMKADGFPTYNFACVVDDCDMGITHVVRGDEHLSNMPRQLLLYEALSLEPPRFAHVPMILGGDGSKLSKRHGATSVGEYRRKGYLSEALVNFIALLGWSPGGDLEIMSLDQMCERFDISRVRKVPSQFDDEKLLWMNGQYIMALPVERLAAELRDFLVGVGLDMSRYDDEWTRQLAQAYRVRMKTFDEMRRASRFFFEDELTYDDAAVKKVFARSDALERLADARGMLAAAGPWTVAELEKRFQAYCDQKGIGLGRIAQPLRAAVTGGTVSPPIFETLVLLGRQRAIKRIDAALGSLAA